MPYRQRFSEEDKLEIRRLYEVELLSFREIARKLQCSNTYVRQILQNQGVAFRKQGNPLGRPRSRRKGDGARQ
jgi:transposase-like protein